MAFEDRAASFPFIDSMSVAMPADCAGPAAAPGAERAPTAARPAAAGGGTGTRRRRAESDPAGGAAQKRPRNLCPHKKQMSACKECGGAGICQHQRERRRCLECQGVDVCPHRRERRRCLECQGVDVCRHNRERSKCKVALCRLEAQMEVDAERRRTQQAVARARMEAEQGKADVLFDANFTPQGTACKSGELLREVKAEEAAVLFDPNFTPEGTARKSGEWRPEVKPEEQGPAPELGGLPMFAQPGGPMSSARTALAPPPPPPDDPAPARGLVPGTNPPGQPCLSCSGSCSLRCQCGCHGF